MSIVLATAATTEPTKDLVAIFVACKVGDKFKQYCVDACIEDVLSLALCATSVERFDDQVCEEAKIKDLPKERNCAKKAWFLACEARDRRTTANATGTAVADDDQPLEIGVLENLRDAWFDTHKWHPVGTRLLSDGQFNRVHRGLHKNPKKLQVVFLETVKTMASLGDDPSQLKGLLVSAKGGVKEQTVSYTDVNSAHDLWMRMRIVLFTICYCTIGTPDFFPLQAMEVVIEYLNELIFHRLDAAAPDILFFNRAYLCSMNDWCNNLRTSDKTLKELTEARSSWTHFWTNYSPSSGHSGASSSTAPAGQIDMSMLPADLVARLNSTHALARSLQSRADSSASARPAAAVRAIEDGSVENTKQKKRKGNNTSQWKKKVQNKGGKGNKGKGGK